MRRKELKSNIMIKLAAVLLFLVLVSTHLTSGMYARYYKRVVAEDSARVASWDVDAVGGKTELTIDCSLSEFEDEYKITVTNNSEVTAGYDIVVLFSSVLDNGITLKLDGTKNPVTNDYKKFVFEDVNQLNLGETSKEHTLTFSANPDDISEDSSYDFYVQVDFEQID